jgi:hypothetical protein
LLKPGFVYYRKQAPSRIADQAPLFEMLGDRRMRSANASKLLPGSDVILPQRLQQGLLAAASPLEFRQILANPNRDGNRRG